MVEQVGIEPTAPADWQALHPGCSVLSSTGARGAVSWEWAQTATVLSYIFRSGAGPTIFAQFPLVQSRAEFPHSAVIPIPWCTVMRSPFKAGPWSRAGLLLRLFTTAAPRLKKATSTRFGEQARAYLAYRGAEIYRWSAAFHLCYCSILPNFPGSHRLRDHWMQAATIEKVSLRRFP